MEKKKIVLVEYFNTEPFMAGLKNLEDQYELLRKIPADCTLYFKNKVADIGLIPVASFFELEDTHMITDYGIGCDGSVRTVMLFSDYDKSEITKIYLDNHSRTSVQLCRIVVKKFWGLNVEFLRADVNEVELNSGEAVLMIGDKVFNNETKFEFAYDLGSEWKKETGLPFVFAVWVSHEKIVSTEESKLNEVFEKGIQEIPNLVEKLKMDSRLDLRSYFENNIVYRIDNKGREAIALFKSMVNTLN